MLGLQWYYCFCSIKLPTNFVVNVFKAFLRHSQDIPFLLTMKTIYESQLKKVYINEAIFLSANDLVLLLNGKKNDL